MTAVQAEPLRAASGVIGPEFIKIFRIKPVEISRFPGWHVRHVLPVERMNTVGDVLIPIDAPRGALPVTITSDRAVEFWIDIEIPKGTAPGEYRGAVKWSTGSSEIAKLIVALTVWPIVLPDTESAPFLADVDHRFLRKERSTEGAKLSAMLQLLRRHRLVPQLPYLAPDIQTDTRGRLSLDWQYYDAVAAPLLSGEAFAERMPLPVWAAPVAPLLPVREDAGSGRGGDSAFAKAYLSLVAAHFEGQGWLERAFVRLPDRDGAGDREWAAELAAAAQGAHDELAILSEAFPQQMGPYGWAGAPAPPTYPVDIWMPRGQYFDAGLMSGERSAGLRTWMRVDRPPFSGTTQIAGSDADVLVLGWQAAKLGAGAVHVGIVNNWPKAASSPEDCLRQDGDTLVYPGEPFGLEAGVPSIRLKLLRRTIQDAALAQLLVDQGLEHVVQALGGALVVEGGTAAYRTSFVDGRRPGWRRDAVSYEQAREIMGAELASRVGPNGGSESAERRRQVAWRQFMLGGRGVETAADGMRLRVSDNVEALAAELEARLTTANYGRVPYSGMVEWGELPQGWEGTGERETIGALSPGSAHRTLLKANGVFARNSADGVLVLPVRLSGEEAVAEESAVRLAVIIAGTADAPPRIDGNLSDWPGGTFNVAGDFLLVARDSFAVPSKVNRPQRRTTAFVLRDASALYIAINAEADRGAMREAPRRQRVEHDDLIPMGEELVEILIDPLNSGARTPEGLFYIAIKPSGAAVSSIGLRHDPPCGDTRPWAADIDVATDVSSDRWTAEVRIPLAAFGSVPTQRTFWGLNITRFDLSAQEYSNWSGAAPNPFDPLSLGNLYLP